MQVIKDTRSGIVYKTSYPIDNDKVGGLNTQMFVKANVLTEEDRWSKERCLDKFPYIKIVGTIDGRTKEAKKLSYFTWGICCH